MKEWTKQIATDLAVWGLIYAGFIVSVDGALYVLQFIIWLLFISSLAVAISVSMIKTSKNITAKDIKILEQFEKNSSKPLTYWRLYTTIFEALIMVWFGWIAAPIAYILSAFFIKDVKSTATDIMQNMEVE